MKRNPLMLAVGLTHPYKSVEDKLRAIDEMTEEEVKEVLKTFVSNWYKDVDKSKK
jgi:hypothetical protein